MTRRGINAKRWFYGLREALSAETNRPCVLAGAACEQWINGELYRVIAQGLEHTSLTAYPEWNRRQHDIAVLRFEPDDPECWDHPVAVVECKVVYLNYSQSKRAKYVDRLLEQLAVPHADTPARVGFLIGIYAFWPDYCHRRRPPRGESFGQFRRSVGEILRSRVKSGINGFDVRVDHGGAMETLFDETRSRIGRASIVVGCVGQYVRLVPR